MKNRRKDLMMTGKKNIIYIIFIILGFSFISQNSYSQNLSDANKWCKLVADQGNRDAQFIYAMFCLHSKDDINGLKYLELSSDNGSMTAKLTLAQIYFLQ